MSTEYDKAPAGGNSSFGNPNRPKDIQGDEPIETPPLDEQEAKKPGDHPAKPAAQATMVHGSVGSGDIH